MFDYNPLTLGFFFLLAGELISHSMIWRNIGKFESKIKVICDEVKLLKVKK